MRPLLQTYDPFREHPAIYSKNFLPGKIHVSIRPFHIAHDLRIIDRWLDLQFSQADSFQYAKDYYTTLLATPNCQPLTGMLDEQPAFQVDIYHALLGPEDLLADRQFNNSDYIMRMLLSPVVMHDLSLTTYCFLSCLDCFFENEEINSVTLITNADDLNSRIIARMADLPEISLEENKQTCYIISKEKFKPIQYNLPAFPAEKKPQSAGILF